MSDIMVLMVTDKAEVKKKYKKVILKADGTFTELEEEDTCENC